ncbi:helix-turn-helix domain-containing protein [Streptomyces erythrochromogenes]|uniref:helix-turn-helix domain-containing protein n=1 Tax=Streptomyces erythrochromogenes TaxID=285574 RepID=UPI00368B26D7
MSQEPTNMSHHKQRVADRRAAVARLTAAGASARSIADELGVSKDTVLRDRAATAAPRRALCQEKAGRAASAMAQLRAAVTAAVDARPAYQILVYDDTAARWIAQLRQDVATLAALLETFDEGFPHLTAPDAKPRCATAPPECAT